MKSRLMKSLLAACAAAPLALLAAPAAQAQAQSVARPANDVVLSIGRGQLVTVAGTMADIFVANDEIADVQIKSQRQLYIFGKAGGETTVYASNAAGDIIWSANVRVGSNIDSVDQMLTLAMPDAKVTVSTMGTNTFLLTGTVAAPEDAAEAQRLVSAFVGAGANVISRLKMATPLQVNLQVRFAEVSRSLARSIGTNLSSIDGTGGIKFGIAQGHSPGSTIATDRSLPFGVGAGSVKGLQIDPNSLFPDPTTGVITPKYVEVDGTSINRVTGATTLAGMGRLFGMNILGTLDAGENIGLVTTLAQPNLTALSGETADFLAGGEYPIPVSQGLGQTTVEYKKYGVSLAYTPTVLANGRISMRVRPEVSELSSQGAVTLNGFQVPALTIRRAETTVELGSGQSFMIAGLLNNNAQNTIEKMPGAGDIPILGSLFRSTSFRKGETELVIVVTPYLVNPVNANDIKLPTDGYNTPNELQRLLGNQDSGKPGSDRPKPSAKDSGAAAGPKVGDASASAGQPGTNDTTDTVKGKQKKQKKDRRARSASATPVPAPGFNLD